MLQFVPSTITLEDPFKDQDTATRGTHAEGNSSSSSDVSSDTSSSSSDSTSHKASESSTAASDSVFLEDIPLNDSGFDSTIPHPEQLFDGSSLSVISALAILFSWFSACPGITKEAFGRLLFILHEFLLPSNNSLPASYADALALIRGLLSPTEDYHCCINDCIVYRGEYKSLTQCPQCREPRYQSGKVPRKRFKYLPIGPRIRRYFSSAQTSQLLQSHHTVASESHGIHDIHHTETWTNWYSSQGIFRGDKRGLALAICADGMNPFAKEKNTYSMWPITVSLLNLHPSLRHLPGFLQLVGVIPGKAEPKNTDPYLQIIVDELHELNDSVMFDAYQNENFFLRTAVLLHIFDYPGQNKVFHCQGKCHLCCNIFPLRMILLVAAWDGSDSTRLLPPLVDKLESKINRVKSLLILLVSIIIICISLVLCNIIDYMNNHIISLTMCLWHTLASANKHCKQFMLLFATPPSLHTHICTQTHMHMYISHGHYILSSVNSNMNNNV